MAMENSPFIDFPLTPTFIGDFRLPPLPTGVCQLKNGVPCPPLCHPRISCLAHVVTVMELIVPIEPIHKILTSHHPTVI